MRITHALGWYFPDSVGGTEIYVAGLCQRLQRDGHDVAVVAPDAAVVTPRAYQHDGVPVFRYPIPAQPTRDEAQGVVAARGTEHLIRWLREHPTDIFHAHGVTTGVGRHEIRAARDAGARTLLTHHLPSLGYICRRGTLMEGGRRPCDGLVAPGKCAACILEERGVPTLAAAALAGLPVDASRVLGTIAGKVGTTFGAAASIAAGQAMQRELVSVTDCMIALNDAALSMLVANGAPPSAVIVNRLGHSHRALPRRATASARLPLRVGFMGRLHPTKGVYELARAMTMLPRPLQVAVEIRGVIQSDVERRVERDILAILDGDPRVTLAPAVPPDRVLDVLAGYDVLCCPSTWFENGPTVAIEAMAVGTPVIGSRLGNLAELVTDGVDGRLVAPGDAADLARAIGDLARSPATLETWRSHLRPARTMDEIAADYVALYAELLAQDGPDRRELLCASAS